jgi:LytS/YehU family sensor histidine kinase
MQDSFKTSDLAGVNLGLPRNAADHVCHGIFSDVEIIVRDKFGKIKHRSVQHNLRTNAGANFWHAQLFGSASATAVAKWMALTTDASAAAAGDTTLASEETLNGLARGTADTINHTSNATTTTLVKTWTYTGSSSKVLAKVGLFDAASTGNLVLETLLSSTATVNANGDTVQVTWTVNF